MKITILTDNTNSWIMPYVDDLKKELIQFHTIHHIYNTSDIVGGDIMFVLSCENIIKKEFLEFHKSNVVVHESKVPQGKGWSPLTWQVLEGVNRVPISLFEVVEAVDAGDVYIIDYIELEGHELNDEIKHKQGLLTMKMVKQYINEFGKIKGTPQSGEESFYPRRGPAESEIDITKPIVDQFNLFRVVDNERYPAHFYINNQKYILKIYKDNN